MSVDVLLKRTIDSAKDNFSRRTWITLANTYGKMLASHQALADEGIIRHARACKKHEITLDADAVREIIADAVEFRQVWKLPDTPINSKN